MITVIICRYCAEMKKKKRANQKAELKEAELDGEVGVPDDVVTVGDTNKGDTDGSDKEKKEISEDAESNASYYDQQEKDYINTIAKFVTTTEITLKPED